MPEDIRIGVYDAEGNLIGYKADSFWTLTSKPDHAKTDWLTGPGGIRGALVQNFLSVLSASSPNPGLVGVIKQINRNHYYKGRQLPLLLGYERLSGGGPTFTYKVQAKGIGEYEAIPMWKE